MISFAYTSSISMKINKLAFILLISLSVLHQLTTLLDIYIVVTIQTN